MMVSVNVISVEGEPLGCVDLPILPMKDDIFYINGRVVNVAARRLENAEITVIVNFID
jgi:hypothetical protein